ncbi:unnamed protein product [Camellia sinensis]
MELGETTNFKHHQQKQSQISAYHTAQDIVIVCWAELVENEVKVRDWTEVDSELLSVRTDGLLLKALGYVACRSGDSAETAADNALAIMQERGFSNPRRSRHWLTPGTVKFVAFHVLSLEGSNGLTILGVAEKIQKSGLWDLTTSKTPEASIVAALSRDLKLFERTTPSTYCVRTPIGRILNGYLDGEDAEDVEHDDVERDEDSESDIAEDLEADDLGTELKPNNEALSCEANRYLAKTLPADGKDTYHDKVMETPEVGVKNLGDSSPLMQSEGYKEVKSIGASVDQSIDVAGIYNEAATLNQEDMVIDESNSGEPWVQGFMEEERLEAANVDREAAIEFAISLIQTLLINDSKVISKLDNFFDALAKLATRPGSPESLQQLVKVARNLATNPATFFTVFVREDNTRQATEQKAPGLSVAIKEDYNIMESVEPNPTGFREQLAPIMNFLFQPSSRGI